jgi:hypothetical protein
VVVRLVLRRGQWSLSFDSPTSTTMGVPRAARSFARLHIPGRPIMATPGISESLKSQYNRSICGKDTKSRSAVACSSRFYLARKPLREISSGEWLKATKDAAALV